MKMNLLNSHSKPKRTILSLLAGALLLAGPVSAQTYVNAQVRNTNCPFAKHQADIWVFGHSAGIDFRDDLAIPYTDNYSLDIYQSPSDICDSLGNLLFFSNGMTVWDRYQNPMPNGQGLHGDMGVSQTSIIIPGPGDNSKYYLFTVDRPPYPGDVNSYGLQYSLIDMNLNNGRGDVDTAYKNVALIPEVTQKITATYASNGIDIWVIAHKWNSNQFVSFLVTADGVNMNYVTSSVGVNQSGFSPDSTNVSLGYLKASPNGTKLASSSYGLRLFEIFDFDNSSGVVSNAISTLPVDYPGAFGVAFSPDSKKLYVSTADKSGSLTFTSRLIQFDVDLGASIFNSPVELATNVGDQNYFTGLQLGTDGRIYVAIAPLGSGQTGVIYNPKRQGLACNYNMLNGVDTPFNLGGKVSQWGFPNFIQNYFDTPHFDVENVCFSDTTILKLTNPANVSSILWDFDDNGSTSTDMEPAHTFSGPGVYNVTVKETYNGIEYTYQEPVTVNELPVSVLPDTVYMYPGSPILLNAGEGYASYEWSTGENTSSIIAGSPGMYYVTLQNDRCCFNTDSVRVVIFDVLVPNAFRPDGVNRLFKAVPTSNQAINNFTMYIYNRWGQQVFESKDIGEGWDGTYNGQKAPGDVYVWLIHYDVQREGGMETITYKGNVVLLR